MGGLFLMAGANKFRSREMTEQYMASKKLPFVPVLRPVAASTELLSAFSLLSGYKPRLGATLAALFLIPTSFIFHNFWKLKGQERDAEMVNFLKNLAIMGGLASIIASDQTSEVRAELESPATRSQVQAQAQPQAELASTKPTPKAKREVKRQRKAS